MLFPKSFTETFKKPRAKPQRVDVIAEQVKKMLQASDQKIILMVRG